MRTPALSPGISVVALQPRRGLPSNRPRALGSHGQRWATCRRPRSMGPSTRSARFKTLPPPLVGRPLEQNRVGLVRRSACLFPRGRALPPVPCTPQISGPRMGAASHVSRGTTHRTALLRRVPGGQPHVRGLAPGCQSWQLVGRCANRAGDRASIALALCPQGRRRVRA